MPITIINLTYTLHLVIIYFALCIVVHININSPWGLLNLLILGQKRHTVKELDPQTVVGRSVKYQLL